MKSVDEGHFKHINKSQQKSLNHDTSSRWTGPASLMARSSTFRTRSRCRNISYKAF